MKYYPKAKSNKIRKEIPEITELLKTQTLQQIADKYKTSKGTLYGYLKETGQVPFKRQKTYPCSTEGCPQTITTSWVKRPAVKCRRCSTYDYRHKKTRFPVKGRFFLRPELCTDCGKEKAYTLKGLGKKCYHRIQMRKYYHRVLKHDPEYIRKRDIRNRKSVT